MELHQPGKCMVKWQHQEITSYFLSSIIIFFENFHSIFAWDTSSQYHKTKKCLQVSDFICPMSCVTCCMSPASVTYHYRQQPQTHTLPLLTPQPSILPRPAWYKKLKQQKFKNNSNRFGTNLDPLSGVFRLSSGNNNESWHKTHSFNVLSYFLLEF